MKCKQLLMIIQVFDIISITAYEYDIVCVRLEEGRRGGGERKRGEKEREGREIRREREGER